MGVPAGVILLAEIGLEIYRMRKEKGLTQDKLAAKSGISKTFISDLENGKKLPRLETAEKLAKALGSCIGFIFNPKDKNAKSKKADKEKKK